MPIRVPVGNEDFEEIRKSGMYYVDKTELLYELAEGGGDKVTILTYPRRFGKTLNLSMLQSFFDMTRDSRAVFEGLAITRRADFCDEWMNRYPVLSISFKGVEDITFESAYATLLLKLSETCRSCEYVLKSDRLSDGDRNLFMRLLNGDVSPAEVKNSLKDLTRILYTSSGRQVILLIDEYDVPLAKAKENDTADNRYYQQMLNLIRGIFSAALKTNEYLKFAVVTGCLRIVKESIFTGTNNFMAYSVLDDRFSAYFGFTEAEMDRLLYTAGLSDKQDVFSAWYDGYVFGRTKVYCPWDVVSYTSALLYDRDAEPRNYWRNTSGNGVIREFVGRFRVSRKFETLMNGGTIIEAISDELTYDLLNESEQNLWSALLMTGYLTKADPGERGNVVSLRIPNAEIAGIFQDSVAVWFRDTLDISRQEALMAALWSGDAARASQLMSDLLWKTISYMDYHEDYYHAFLAGLFVGRGYETESNRERGLGRPDLLLVDTDNRRAIIIETKKAADKARLDAACDAALSQIAQRRYADEIEDGYQTVLCYGVAFYQKTALIKLLQ